MTYTVEASKYVRGMALICCPPDDDLVNKSREAALACAFSGNRYSHRERGYLVSTETLKHYTRAVRAGCTSDGVNVAWESDCKTRFYKFSPQHPARMLRCIGRDGR